MPSSGSATLIPLNCSVSRSADTGFCPTTWVDWNVGSTGAASEDCEAGACTVSGACGAGIGAETGPIGAHDTGSSVVEAPESALYSEMDASLSSGDASLVGMTAARLLGPGPSAPC